MRIWRRQYRPSRHHVVVITDTGYSLTHPPRCGRTYTCPVNRGLRATFDATLKRGMFVSLS